MMRHHIGILVSATFYWKKRIGYKAWRLTHVLLYLMFVLVPAYAALLGTDSAGATMKLVYIFAGASVLFLTLFRVLTASGRRTIAPEVPAA